MGQPPSPAAPRRLLAALFDEAVTSVSAEQCLPQAIKAPLDARYTGLVAVDKATALANVVFRLLTGRRLIVDLEQPERLRRTRQALDLDHAGESLKVGGFDHRSRPSP